MSATKTERTVKGMLGTKLGMTQTWDENNRIVPVTVIAASTIQIAKSIGRNRTFRLSNDASPSGTDPVWDAPVMRLVPPCRIVVVASVMTIGEIPNIATPIPFASPITAP